MDNYTSEPHREHTFAAEEFFQLLHDGRLADHLHEVILLILFFLRVIFWDVHVALVVVVESRNRSVDRPIQESHVLKAHKPATAMCV